MIVPLTARSAGGGYSFRQCHLLVSLFIRELLSGFRTLFPESSHCSGELSNMSTPTQPL